VLWLFPVAGFFAVGLLLRARSSRESFLGWRDGVTAAFYLCVLASFLAPLRGPHLPGSEEPGPVLRSLFASVSAWDGRAPASILASVLWAAWKSSRGRSLFLSKFFLALAVLTTAGVAFSPSHYALSAFLSPLAGFSGAALARRFRKELRARRT
jgi:hypothetical protein